jgi:hypothetical protein
MSAVSSTPLPLMRSKKVDAIEEGGSQRGIKRALLVP